MVDGSRDVLWTRIEDGAERAVTRTPKREESWPYWSQEAGCLVFQVTAGPGRSDLFQWSPEDGERPLIASRRDERWPAWSPVAARLVYAFVGGRPAAGLGLAEADTGESHVIADAGPEHVMLRPSWSPDGRRVAVQLRPRKGGPSRLRVVELDGAASDLPHEPGWSDTKGRFTRDGERVVFTRAPAGGGPADVWSVARDGSDARLLIAGEGTEEHSGRPSPARDELVFVSDRSGSPQVWLADLDGRGARRLTAAPGGAFTPRWSPDGEWLVVSVSEALSKPRLADPTALEGLRLQVIDREGRVHFETRGFMPDWMPAWR
jgi:Tol biopolymer transport system component